MNVEFDGDRRFPEVRRGGNRQLKGPSWRNVDKRHMGAPQFDHDVKAGQGAICALKPSGGRVIPGRIVPREIVSWEIATWEITTGRVRAGIALKVVLVAEAVKDDPPQLTGDQAGNGVFQGDPVNAQPILTQVQIAHLRRAKTDRDEFQSGIGKTGAGKTALRRRLDEGHTEHPHNDRDRDQKNRNPEPHDPKQTHPTPPAGRSP